MRRRRNWTHPRKASFDDVDAQLRQLPRDVDLLIDREGGAGRLLAITERRVEYPHVIGVTDVVRHVLWPRSAQRRDTPARIVRDCTQRANTVADHCLSPPFPLVARTTQRCNRGRLEARRCRRSGDGHGRPSYAPPQVHMRRHGVLPGCRSGRHPKKIELPPPKAATSSIAQPNTMVPGQCLRARAHDAHLSMSARAMTSPCARRTDIHARTAAERRRRERLATGVGSSSSNGVSEYVAPSEEGVTYKEKIAAAQLKIDWRFPRPGLLYPWHTRNHFLLGWNAVRVLRERESADPAITQATRRTGLSVASYCMLWLWYLVPTPFAFAINAVLVETVRPLLHRAHKQAVLLDARLKAAAARRSGDDGLFSTATVLAAYHGNANPFDHARQSIRAIIALAFGSSRKA